MPNPIPEIEALLANIHDGKDIYSRAFALHDACATLLALLKEYGGHTDDCQSRWWGEAYYNSNGPRPPCTCGWAAIEKRGG